MARIRSIKPTFFTSISNSELPIPTRLTFIGLWTYVDDDGRGVDDPRLIKAAVWPLDESYTAKKIEADLVRLEKADKLERYVVDGRRYLRVRAFGDHQVINRPQPSKLPPSPDETLAGRSDSVSDHGTLTEDSGPEGNGTEGSRNRELEWTRSSSSSSSHARPPSSDDDDVIDQALKLLAERALARRVHDKGPVEHVGRWLTTVAKERRRRHETTARQLVAGRPDVTADELADELEPESRPPRPPTPPRPPCDACNDVRWVLDDDDTARPCPECSPAP